MFEKHIASRLTSAVLVCLSVALAAAAPAAAQDLFSVLNIRVDERAFDEVTAKYNGISKAQQAALRTVLRRLVMPGDYGRLVNVDPDDLVLMVADYAVADEKFGGGRYLANLSVRFIPEEVSLALRAMGVPFAMTQSRPVVVLPVISAGGARRLWDDPNAWRTAWDNRGSTSGLFKIVVPIGDLSDIAAIDSNRAIARNETAHRAIAVKYQASGTMLADLLIGRNSKNAPSAEVSLIFFGGNYDGAEMSFSYEAPAGTSVPVFMQLVVREIVNELETKWRRENLLDFSREERLSVLVPISGLADWLEIRGKLETMARIQNINVARMTRGEAEIDLVYVGATDQLRAALSQQGLELVFSPDRPLWLLQRSGGN